MPRAGCARRCATLRIAGIRTDRELLIALLGEPDFLAGRTTTRYLDMHPDLAQAGVVAGDDLTAQLLAVVFADEQRNRAADAVTGFAPSGWRNLRTAGQRRTWLNDGVPNYVEYVIDGDRRACRSGRGRCQARTVRSPPIPDVCSTCGCSLAAAERQVVEVDGIRHAVDVAFHGDAAVSRSRAGSVTWLRPPRFADHESDFAGSGPVCPLPGRVIAVHVEPGARVVTGRC